MFIAPVFLTPLDMQRFAYSVTSVLTFSANFFFWQETASYWSTTSELKPLLHTWSLAVEEQFYIFFPLLMLLFAKTHANQRVVSIAALTVVSLCICIVATPISPSASFYLLPTRAWEFGAGVLVALTAHSSIKSTRIREIGSYIGLSLIVFAILTFDESTVFPGVAALITVLGTSLLIIYAGPTTSIGRWLSQQWLVSLGLMSYSAYLWHQPVLAFYRSHASVDFELPVALGLLLFSLLLSYLT